MNKSLALKIYTANGVTKDNVFEGQTVLHLGCGDSKLSGSIGVDLLPLKSVDVVHNLDKCPWPFEDSSVDVIVAHSVLEHVSDVVSFFNEASRVCKNGAKIIIEVPYFRSIDSYTDPTHKHFFTSSSLDYFLDDNNSLANYQYSNNKFKKIGFWYGWPQKSKNIFAQAFKNFIYKHKNFYDQYLSLLLPMKVLFWELEVRK